jgi:ribosomal protein S6--L-glutamate ligase
MPKKVILGSEEWCSFPELDIPTKSPWILGAKHLRYAINIAPSLKRNKLGSTLILTLFRTI